MESKPRNKINSNPLCLLKTAQLLFRKILVGSVILYVCVLFAGDSELPPSTVINQNDTFAKIIFKPSVVQQAKIAQNGILGDFIVRYDVNREQSIGDIQVMGSSLPFPVNCLYLSLDSGRGIPVLT